MRVTVGGKDVRHGCIGNNANIAHSDEWCECVLSQHRDHSFYLAVCFIKAINVNMVVQIHMDTSIWSGCQKPRYKRCIIHGHPIQTIAAADAESTFCSVASVPATTRAEMGWVSGCVGERMWLSGGEAILGMNKYASKFNHPKSVTAHTPAPECMPASAEGGGGGVIFAPLPPSTAAAAVCRDFCRGRVRAYDYACASVMLLECISEQRWTHILFFLDTKLCLI